MNLLQLVICLSINLFSWFDRNISLLYLSTQTTFSLILIIWNQSLILQQLPFYDATYIPGIGPEIAVLIKVLS